MDYFPLTPIVGKNFCNRKSEILRLGTNIHHNKHTLIMAPRRYGKTSLVAHTLEKQKIHYAQMDFLSVIHEDDVESIILQSIGELIGRLAKAPQKALKIATDLFAGLNIRVSLEKIGIQVELSARKKTIRDRLSNILNRVDKLAIEHQTNIVLFFDEFQRMYEINDNHVLEAILREFAQKTKHIAFVFSGSNRHLLNKIFSDKSRPFYNMCDRIVIKRIPKSEYTHHIQKAAKAKWGTTLDKDVIEIILDIVSVHPYYVNLLCTRLWYGLKPTAEIVFDTWEQLKQEGRSSIAEDLDRLAFNQKKLLIAIARYGDVDKPRSADFEQFSRMSGSSVTQALTFLERHDFVYKSDEGFYRVLDPLVAAVLAD